MLRFRLPRSVSSVITIQNELFLDVVLLTTAHIPFRPLTKQHKTKRDKNGLKSEPTFKNKTHKTTKQNIGLQESTDLMFKSNIELNHKPEAHLETGILKTRHAPMRIFQFNFIFVVSYVI